MFKNTPGPWRLLNRLNDGYYIQQDPSYRRIDNQRTVTGDAGIARIHTDPWDDMPDEEQQANARLLAAAPEMQATLYSLISIFEEQKSFNFYDFTHIINDAKKIMAKLGDD